MLTDPVFQVLQDYKDTHKGDVIRYELAIRAEINRVKQYHKFAYTEKSKKQLKGVEHAMIDNLNAVLALIPSYLNTQFNENLKKTNFWDRKALKANCLNWKYTFYSTERREATTELIAILSTVTKVTIKQVKESAI